MKNVILIRTPSELRSTKACLQQHFFVYFYGVVYKKWSVFSIDFTTIAAYWQLIQHTLFSGMMKYQMQYMCPLKKTRLYSFTKLVNFYHYYKENTQKCKTVYLLFGVTHMLIPKRIWIHNEIKQECLMFLFLSKLLSWFTLILKWC